jgi:hypothetical protein
MIPSLKGLDNFGNSKDKNNHRKNGNTLGNKVLSSIMKNTCLYIKYGQFTKKTNACLNSIIAFVGLTGRNIA